MGCLFVIVLACLSAVMIHFAGYALWVMLVLGILWMAALVVSTLVGHRGFGGGGNTDLMIVIAGASIMLAIFLPKYNDQKPCNQAEAVLRKLADAENEYFSQHKIFASDIRSLNLAQRPDVSVTIVKGDQQSFTATASQGSCSDKNGSPTVFTWDSANGGLQLQQK